MARPMLDDVELQQVQEIQTEQDQVLAQHGVPALEGDFLQGLGRRATQVTLTGVLTGPEVGEGLKTLREKFRAATPVPFVADITTATKVDQVLIEEMGVRELAGKPERFEYALTLREFILPPAVEAEEPPEPDVPPPPDDDIDQNVGTLEVEVIVEGDPNFDFSTTTVTVEGTQEDGTDLSRTLTNRENNVWTEEDFPPGQYTARAVVPASPPAPSMTGSANAVVRAGQTTRVTITLRRDRPSNIAVGFVVHFRFDKAFVEPCIRRVLRRVAEHARIHRDEKLLIVGNTDRSGSDVYNLSLGDRRARSVYAYLTIGRDPAARAAALAEWNALRVQRPAGELPSVKDSWGTREYQYMLQDLGFYPGNVDGDHGAMTREAVRAFQQDKGLPATGAVDDATWSALIEAYLSRDESVMNLPESQFLPNCPGEVLKWISCGEQRPRSTTPSASCAPEIAWRPNRRTELLFIRADALPRPEPKPVTFDLPPQVGSSWCVGPTNPDPLTPRCTFLVENCPTTASDQICVEPAEPGTISVSGSIVDENGTPLGNRKYVLIAPDGEFMDGEKTCGADRGRPVPGRTRPDGTFDYTGKSTPVGTYTMEVDLPPGPHVAHAASEPPATARGSVVCKRLTASDPVFDVIVRSGAPSTVSLEFVAADNADSLVTSARVGDTMRVRADLPGIAGDEVTVEISGADAIQGAITPPPPPPPAIPALEFVAADNADNPAPNVRVGGNLRLRADMPGVTGDEITVDIFGADAIRP